MYDVLLILFAVNFKYYASVFSILLLMYLAYNRGYIEIVGDDLFKVLIFSSLSYAVLYIANYGIPIPTIFVIRFVTPIITLYLGYNRAIDKEINIKRDIIIIAFVEAFHGLANVISNWNTDILSIQGRAYKDIFGDSVSATLQNLFFNVAAGMLFYWIVYGKNKKIKMIGIVLSLAGIFNSIKTASRTTIFLTVIAFFIGYIIYNIEKTDLILTALKTIFIVVIIAVGVYLIYIFDVGDIQEKFAQTELGIRLSRTGKSASFSENARWEYALEILKLLPNYPLGGMDYSHYAHNFWVDVSKETGIIPFIAYIIFFILVIKKIWIFIRMKDTDKELKVMLAPIVLIMFISFFTEPILQGSPKTFGVFCYFIGIIMANNMKCEENSSEAFWMEDSYTD